MKRFLTSLIINKMHQNHNIISHLSPHTYQDGYHQKNLQTINAGEGVEKREPLALLVGM